MALCLIFRKKKKNKEIKKLVEVATVVEEETSAPAEIKRTKAEIAFQKMKEKTVRYYNHLKFTLYTLKLKHKNNFI